MTPEQMAYDREIAIEGLQRHAQAAVIVAARTGGPALCHCLDCQEHRDQLWFIDTITTLQQEKAALEGRCSAFEARIDAHNARYDCTEKLSDARDDVDFWKAECAAAKESRDAACHERDAHAEAANQAEATTRRLREALVKVRAHTGYLEPADIMLLRGLLSSVERITEAALAGTAEGEL